MADIKYTKNEMVRLQAKELQLEQYLPTLKLKKMLLQSEVAKAEEEIRQAQSAYDAEKEEMKQHGALLKDAFGVDILAHCVIEKVVVEKGNIAGIELPVLKEVIFQEKKEPLFIQPLWKEAFVTKVHSIITTYRKVKIAEERRNILQHELRKISIRVNLFEKRLIPEIQRDINKIRVFLSDLDLQAVGKAKVAKNKIVRKKELLV